MAEFVKLLTEPSLIYRQLNPKKHTTLIFCLKFKTLYQEKSFENVVWKIFCPAMIIGPIHDISLTLLTENGPRPGGIKTVSMLNIDQYLLSDTH